MTTPLISVVMPVWNGEMHLREAIDSILAQSESDFEFLIIDDGSTDGTREIINSYGDSRVRLIEQDHKGIVVALNRGVEEARAGWIARMDADDSAHPERFASQLAALRQYNNSVLCHTQINIFGEQRYLTRTARFVKSEALVLLKLCYQCPIVHPTVMFRKSTFLAIGGYREEERHAEDYGLWGRLINHGAVVGVEEPLLDLRVHGNSISKQKAEVQKQLGDQIALRHCKEFLRLSSEKAERALGVLRMEPGSCGPWDWIWLLTTCLPRLRCQSFELWMWAFRQSALRFLRLFQGWFQRWKSSDIE